MENLVLTNMEKQMSIINSELSIISSLQEKDQRDMDLFVDSLLDTMNEE